MTDEERKRRRAVANMLLINYKADRHVTLATKAPPGVPLGAPFEEWRAYNCWVLDWLGYCRRVKDQHG